MLPIGDIIVKNKPIVIERKTINDFYNSVITQHLHSQIIQMRQAYDNPYIVVSGTYKELLNDYNLTNLNINVFIGAMASFSTKYGVPVLTVENDKQLALLVVKMLEKIDEVPDLIPVKRLQFNADSLKLACITAVKGVSQEKAKKILDKYPSIKDLCNATTKDLQEIDGIGKVLSENIKEVFQ